MTAYIIRRLLFMVPTMFGIMLVAFVVVQFAPGGPVEQVIAKLSGGDTGAPRAFPARHRATSAAAAWRKAARASTRSRPNIAARRGSIRNSSRNSKSSSASTSRPMSASD